MRKNCRNILIEHNEDQHGVDEAIEKKNHNRTEKKTKKARNILMEQKMKSTWSSEKIQNQYEHSKDEAIEKKLE